MVQRVAAFLLIAIFLAFLVFSRGRLWWCSTEQGAACLYGSACNRDARDLRSQGSPATSTARSRSSLATAHLPSVQDASATHWCSAPALTRALPRPPPLEARETVTTEYLPPPFPNEAHHPSMSRRAALILTISGPPQSSRRRSSSFQQRRHSHAREMWWRCYEG